MSKKTILVERAHKTVYKENNLVVKEFDENYPKSDVLNEALNQARVEETGLEIPKIMGVTNDKGKWSIHVEAVEGKTLEELMKENPSKVDEYLNEFVDLQLEVQSKKSPLLNKCKDKMVGRIESLSGTISATVRYELRTRLEGMPKHNKVLHGDFEPANIIIDQQQKAHIIDWAHATQGNASADAATTYLIFTLKYPELAEKYLELFCEKTDTAKQYVQKWLPIVAASRLAKAIPEEKEILEKWIDVVDYE